MKTTLAAAAVLLTSSSASAFFVELIPGQTSVRLGADGTATFDVSFFLDRDGSTDGFFADFVGWYRSSMDFELTGAADWVMPTENLSDDSDGAWYGRRPSSEPGLTQSGFGSFRNSSDSISYEQRLMPDGSKVLGGAGFAFPIEAYQNGTLVGVAPDPSDRIEIFRAQVVANSTGTITFDVLMEGLDILIDSAGISRSVIRDLNGDIRTDLVEVRTGSIEVLAAPAPGATLALLGVAGVTRRRRS